MVILFLVFYGTPILFTIVVLSSLHSHQQCKKILFSSPPFIICWFFDDGHSDRCEVVPYCSFDLHFSNVMLSIFSCICWPSASLLWRNVYLGLPLFFWLDCLLSLLLSCMSCLYILDINLLSTASFVIILFHSEICFFILLMVSFDM